MESFVHEYITSTYDGDLDEDLLDQHSPYATLRAGDLAALLRLQTPLPPIVSTSFNFNHGDDDNNVGLCNKIWSSHDVDDEEPVFCDEERKDTTQSKSDTICRGSDTNDSPAEYRVTGLHHHEMPVIGVCVDERICPGFKYNVRRTDKDSFIFEMPKTLLSIGMGYGKRMTFSGESLNNNECYFWSDSEPNGYAFSIHAVDAGQRFSIIDADNVIVGEVIVDNITEPQIEISSVVKEKSVIKQVNVALTCSMKYYQRHNHGLMEMMAHEDSEAVNGVAILRKTKSSKTALLVSIENIFLERFGICKFELDV